MYKGLVVIVVYHGLIPLHQELLRDSKTTTPATRQLPTNNVASRLVLTGWSWGGWEQGHTQTTQNCSIHVLHHGSISLFEVKFYSPLGGYCMNRVVLDMVTLMTRGEKGGSTRSIIHNRLAGG